MIKHCGCTSKDGLASDFQDREYGQGQRVHNEMQSGEKKQCRCTICGKVKD